MGASDKVAIVVVGVEKKRKRKGKGRREIAITRLVRIRSSLLLLPLSPPLPCPPSHHLFSYRWSSWIPPPRPAMAWRRGVKIIETTLTTTTTTRRKRKRRKQTKSHRRIQPSPSLLRRRHRRRRACNNRWCLCCLPPFFVRHSSPLPPFHRSHHTCTPPFLPHLHPLRRCPQDTCVWHRLWRRRALRWPAPQKRFTRRKGM